MIGRQPSVTVAVPVLNGGRTFAVLLEAVRSQEWPDTVELLICDSGSSDGSVGLAREAGARVLEIPPEQFSHGGTRNVLMAEARGDVVAFLTHDAVPASPRWLAALVAGFAAADDVALVFGPYVPRPDASLPVARELREWFAALAPDGRPRVDRLDTAERAAAEAWRLGPHRLFFTDANGCVARAAWEKVPFRDVPYAEDQQLALDMLRAGFTKVYAPDAAVVHSHAYAPLEQLRRAFDEWRGLHATTGLVEPIGLSAFRGHVSSRVRADAREARASGSPLVPVLLESSRHHGARWAGALLGSRSERLPAVARRRLSLDGRA